MRPSAPVGLICILLILPALAGSAKEEGKVTLPVSMWEQMLLTLEYEKDGIKSGRLSRWRFHELPTRPMIQINLHPGDMDAAKLRSYLESTIGELPEDGIVKLKIHGRVSQEAMAVLRAPSLRSLAPPTMNINTVFKEYNFF